MLSEVAGTVLASDEAEELIARLVVHRDPELVSVLGVANNHHPTLHPTD